MQTWLKNLLYRIHILSHRKSVEVCLGSIHRVLWQIIRANGMTGCTIMINLCFSLLMLKLSVTHWEDGCQIFNTLLT